MKNNFMLSKNPDISNEEYLINILIPEIEGLINTLREVDESRAELIYKQLLSLKTSIENIEYILIPHIKTQIDDSFELKEKIRELENKVNELSIKKQTTENSVDKISFFIYLSLSFIFIFLLIKIFI